MKDVVHEVNQAKLQSARTSTKAGKVVVTGAILQNAADNEEFEAVFKCETLRGVSFTWSERLSAIKFDRLGSDNDLYMVGADNCSLQLIGL